MTSKEIFEAWYHPNFFVDPKTLAWEAWKQSRKALADEQAQAVKPVTAEKEIQHISTKNCHWVAKSEFVSQSYKATGRTRYFSTNPPSQPPAGEPTVQELSDGEIYSRISRRVAEINATFTLKTAPFAWLRSLDLEPISDALKQASPDFYAHYTTPLYLAAPKGDNP